MGTWIGEIQASDDINPAWRLALHELFEKRFDGNLSHDDIRADELPEPLPIMNLRTMTGGE